MGRHKPWSLRKAAPVEASCLGAHEEPFAGQGPTGQNERWQRVEFLQRESHQLASTVQALQAHLVAIMLGSFTVLTASAIGLAQFEKYDILLVVPAVLPLAWLTGTRLLAELFVCAAQRRAIEVEIQTGLKTLGSDAGFRPWESIAGRLIVRSVSNFGFYAWFSAFSALLGVSCIAAAWINDSDRTLLWLSVGTFVAGGSVAVVSGIGAVRLFDRVPPTFPAEPG